MYGEVIKKEIEVIAYDLWEKAGKPKSDGVDFWLRAEKKHLEYLESCKDDFFWVLNRKNILTRYKKKTLELS